MNLIVVNFFGFLVIEKNPSERFWRKLGEILPTILPELSKPNFLKSKRGKTKIYRPKFRKKSPEPPRLLNFERSWGEVWGRFLEDFGKGLEDLGRSLEVKTGGSNPKTSKTRISLFNWKFPYFSYRKSPYGGG